MNKSLKELTKEQLIEYYNKQEEKRIKHNEYYRNKYNTNDEYREKKRKNNRQNYIKRKNLINSNNVSKQVSV
jgi:hypothetical protein